MILLGYLALAMSAVMHAVFLAFTIVVVFRAAKFSSRERYFPALFWGLVGNAVAPLAWSLSWLVMSGPPQIVQMIVFDAPLSLINGLLHAIAPFALRFNLLLVNIAYVGLHIGAFSALYLIVSRRKANPAARPGESASVSA
jgi:hypothetical protein